MAFASARRDWARYRRGECDLIPALSYFAFGCVTVIVALMAVLETATFLFDWPTQARQYAGQMPEPFCYGRKSPYGASLTGA